MNSFLIAFLIGLGCYAIVFFVPIFFRILFKKRKFDELFKRWNNLYCLALFLVLETIALLFVFLSYSRTTYFSVVSQALILSLITCFVPIENLVFKLKSKEFTNLSALKIVGYVGVIAIFLIENFAFSSTKVKKDQNSYEISLVSDSVVETNAAKENGCLIFNEQRQYFILDNTNHDISSLKLDFSSSFETKLQIDIWAYHDGDYFYQEDYKFNPNYELTEYFDLSKENNADFIKVILVIDETNLSDVSEIPTVTLKSVQANVAFPFVFNPLRFVLLAAAFVTVLLIIKKGADLIFKSTDNISLIQKIILLLSGVGVIVLIIHSVIFQSTHYLFAQDLNEPGAAIYYQLFDAFRKGQVNLDIPVSEGLKNLPNPYDPTTRGGIDILWDRAYYQGNYYCYYGCVPVLLVMFPIYLVTGFTIIPSLLFILEIGTLFSITTFLLLILELVKKFVKQVNYPVLIFLLVGALIVSLLLSNCIYKIETFDEGIYRIPYAYGLGFYFLTIYLLLMAFDKRKTKWRMVQLGFAAFSVVCMIGSRPTLIFGLIFAVPLVLKIIFEKKPWKTRIIEFVPFLSVIIVGAVLICWYNKARFNSILEFGQSYQLTVADNTKLSYSAKGIVPTLLNFFICPPSANNTFFPFFDYGSADLAPRYHNYYAGSFGIFFIPMTWGLFCLPFVFDKKDNIWLRISLYLSPAILFLIAFTTYCFAGVCPRYVVEMASIGIVLSFVPLYKMFELLYQKKKRTSLSVLILLVIIGSFIPLNLLFSAFDGWNEGAHHGILEIVRSIFNNYNI